jgi:hypothetical protein
VLLYKLEVYRNIFCIQFTCPRHLLEKIDIEPV